MDMDFVANLIGGYAETKMGLDERDFQREAARRKARLDILSAALPSITDPTLKAEALAMAEEFATGKSTGKGKQGVLSQILGGLIGRSPQDVGQGAKLQEFFGRPREGTARAMVRPPAATEVPLPEVPGVFGPGTQRVQVPGVTENVPTTIRGPFPTQQEQMEQHAAAIRADALARAQAAAEVEGAQREQFAQEARKLGLTDPRDIANYVNQRTLPSEAYINRLVNVAGTVSGRQLMTQFRTDSLGNEISPDAEYRVARSADGRVTGAYPVSPTSTGLRGEWQRDVDSSTGWSHAFVSPATGKVASVVRDVMPPTGYLPSTSSSQSVRFVQQADGNYVAVPVTTTTTRGREVPGAVPQGPAGGARPAGVQPRPALPPVPGTPTAVKPSQVVGAKPGPEPVVKTADGRTVVGHKAMTVADRRDIGSVALSLYLAQELNGLLNAPDPTNAERRLRDRTGGWEQVSDALKARWGAARYTTVGMTSGSEFLQKAMPLSNLARVIFASPYLKGVRAYQWVQDIQRHIPDATKQSPAAMAERLDVLVPVLQNMRSDLQAELGLNEDQMAQFMRDAAADQKVPAGNLASPTPAAKKKIPPLPPSLR